jgi:hypothetical protein
LPLTLDATVSGAASNAYCDRTAANAYFDGRLNASAYTAEADVGGGKREQALVMATSILDRLPWIGTVAVKTQRLQHPRSWMLKPYDSEIYVPENALPPIPGVVPGLPEYWPVNAVARPIVEATCELALELLRASEDLGGEETITAIQSESVAGAVSTTYVDPEHRARGLSRFPGVWRCIAPYLQSTRQPIVRRA